MRRETQFYHLARTTQLSGAMTINDDSLQQIRSLSDSSSSSGSGSGSGSGTDLHDYVILHSRNIFSS